MAMLWANNASTTIVGAVAPADTQVTVSPGTGVRFPNPTGGDFFVATFYDQATKSHNEIVHVTARDAVNTDLFTIVRAQEGTTAGTWNTADIFANLITAGTLEQFQQAGPLNTEIVYVGQDVSTVPNLVVAATSPVPSGFVQGMLFNIKIANTNTGAVSVANGGGMELNGLAAVDVTRTDGSDLVGGNLVAGEEMTFIYNGINPGGSPTFMALIGPYLTKPPTNLFYVTASGNDNNDGLSPDPSHAFRTISGAMAAIASRYISQSGVTISVGPGLYRDSPLVNNSYISNWLIVGDRTTPANVVIDATSTTSGSGGGYPSNSWCGYAWAFLTGGNATVTLSGLTFQSALSNIGCGGNSTITVYGCNFTAPTYGTQPCIFAVGGKMTFFSDQTYGTNCQYTGNIAAVSLFTSTGNGSIALGYDDGVVLESCIFNINGPCSFNTGTVVCEAAGVFGITSAVASFGGTVPTGPKYAVLTAGGIYTPGSTADAMIPGTVGGTKTDPGWLQQG